MNNDLVRWAAPENLRTSPTTMLPIVVKEWRRHKVLLVSIFTVMALVALVLGMVLPKKYASTTTILVEESNIIGPLMEGRAVPTGVANRAAIAREVAFSQKVMLQVLETGGWLANHPTPLMQDKLIEDVKNRTSILNPRENLIQITYTDPDPTRAFTVTRRFAELVMQESLQTKERESREAYEFIDSQVEQYHRALTEAETKLERYRNANPDARPGVDVNVNARIGELRRLIDTAGMDLIDQRSLENSLSAQISGEAEISMVQTRAGQIQARLAELQSERDRLLLTYTERHPDVIRTQHQIADLQEELRREDTRQESRMAGAPTALGSSTIFNPLYGELKSKLASARSQSAASASRIAEGRSLLAEELARSRRISTSESSLAELTRDYEVNRELYQDLQKRRENARVSMNLDAERRGLSFRIQEPAAIPLRASGIRLVHVASSGLGVAILAPLLLLLIWVRFDPRVRTPVQIEREAGLPVLVSVPGYVSRPARSQEIRHRALAIALFLTVPIAYGLVLALKIAHTI